MKLGEFEIHLLSDGTFALDGGQMFGVVPKVLWEKKMPADSRNRIRMGLNCLLIQTSRRNILIETGIGEKFDAKLNDIYAVNHSTTLPLELQKIGLELSDIHIVINTHLHFDHCGWNAQWENGKLVPTFPQARYYVQRGEWEHALHPTERDRASYVPDFFLAAGRQTEFMDGNTEIISGISVEVTPGHNRNLQCVRIVSGGESAYFISDLVPTQAHLRFPWIMAFDLFPLETLSNKQRLLPQLAEQEALVIFPHDAETPWVRLVQTEDKITPVPVS
ncbi:MAG TPA: MBL fold metallo-hydrolase [Terriglobia bacterium]|nr:MBL fold metallo-hydrolase [Terriglobia bacterium]